MSAPNQQPTSYARLAATPIAIMIAALVVGALIGQVVIALLLGVAASIIYILIAVQR